LAYTGLNLPMPAIERSKSESKPRMAEDVRGDGETHTSARLRVWAFFSGLSRTRLRRSSEHESAHSGSRKSYVLVKGWREQSALIIPAAEDGA
jgi:hypothetical protein